MGAGKGQTIFGAVLAVVLAAAIFWLAWKFVVVFLLANPSVQASIIAAFFGLISLVFTYWKERTRSLREAHRDKKIEVYSIFYDFIFQLMKDSKAGKEVDPTKDPEFISKWMDMTRGVLFYGSPKVVTAFADFRDQTPNQNDPSLVLRKVGRILLAMRDDIGLGNSGLDELSIHQIYVTDDITKVGKVK